MKPVKTVDEYIAKARYGTEILLFLRDILLSTGLKETIKWGSPVYTLNGKNIVGMGSFKTYSGLWFFQGALLNDNQNVLINAQQDKTKALRQWRFTSVQEIEPELVKQYVHEAVQNQKANREIKPDRNKPLEIPEELNNVFLENTLLKTKFHQFTPGKQREFAEYVNDAKRKETKVNRVTKILPLIMNGIGLNDKYRR